MTESTGPTELANPQSSPRVAGDHSFRALLLPIKDLRNAKQRLAQVLTPTERFGLATAMLADTLRAVRSVQRADAVFVVTNYEPVLETARQEGWQVIRETEQTSESASVDFASRFCAELGVSGLLRLPLDLPLAQASDIDELLSVECQSPAVVLVPSRDGTGTNGILRTPPALFPSHFGPDSFAKHQREAEQIGAEIILRRNPRLEMDVDDEADLRVLLQHDLAHTATGKWLQESGVANRFSAAASAAAGATG